MSLPWNVNASMGGAGVNYQIQRSLRLRSSATAYLNKTFSSSGTDLRKWTLSFWMKRGALSVQSVPFSCQDTPGTGASSVYFLIGSGNTIGVFYPNTGANLNVGTAAVLRDPSAWYHVLFAFDTTQATSTDRIKIYINGVQQTLSGGGTYPTLNSTTTWNSNCPHFISKNPVASSDYFDGYFAEIYNIDGQALTPTSFGYNDPVTGVWQPAPFKGTYGTNGFYLPFTDIATTSGSNFGLGRDYSGNANYFNTNNISVTSGATYDSMIDSPTSFSDGSTYYNRGNYAVLNPLANIYTQVSTINNGNLDFSDSSSSNRWVGSTMSSGSGKWYFEMTATNSGTFYVGLMDYNTKNESWYRNNGSYSSSFGGSGTTGYSSWTTNDIIGVAWDSDAGKIWFAKNNTWQSGSPSSGTSPTNTFTAGLSLFPEIYTDNSAGTKSGSFNFGQRPFTYTPPTGFKALNTFNLPTPTIANGAAYMAATLYTGTGSTLNVVNNNNTIGTTFAPDFVWIKSRSQVASHGLFDTVRGEPYAILSSNSTAAESTGGSYISSFGGITSNGFQLNTNTSGNNSGSTYVGWQWKAGAGTTSTNTSGTITSTVSASPSSGFSIATYTGNGTAGATVGHSLGVAPSMIIVKRRSAAEAWGVYHTSLGATQAINLELTVAAYSYSIAWNNTAPTSSVFSLGTWAAVNSSGGTFVAYCFSAVRGYSAFGSYTGNGSSDGPFVYTGFRPRFIIAKNATTGGAAYDWDMVDTSRNPYNPGSQLADLAANLSRAEQTIGGTNLDILSNGFKMRSTDGVMNGNGNTIIYAAFAENPFNYSRAR